MSETDVAELVRVSKALVRSLDGAMFMFCDRQERVDEKARELEQLILRHEVKANREVK